jgi:hypothetical protein
MNRLSAKVVTEPIDPTPLAEVESVGVVRQMALDRLNQVAASRSVYHTRVFKSVGYLTHQVKLPRAESPKRAVPYAIWRLARRLTIMPVARSASTDVMLRLCGLRALWQQDPDGSPSFRQHARGSGGQTLAGGWET